MAEFIRFNSPNHGKIILNLGHIVSVQYSEVPNADKTKIIIMTSLDSVFTEVGEIADKLYAKLSKISSEI